MTTPPCLRVAAIVPCHDEEQTVGAVVRDLRAAVPGITVFVYDNASTDRTAEVAARAGAVVCAEPRRGKGNVIRRAFADIDADVYLLIDGDDTYDAAAAPALIERLTAHNLDQVIGVRRVVQGASAYRPHHQLGNRVLNAMVSALFGDSLGDMLSGFRVFSRRFVKSFPAVSREFEIETELTVHSLALRIPTDVVEVDFRDRPLGSESKLRTYRDGVRILRMILGLTRYERPVLFFGLFAVLTALGAAGLGAEVLVEYLRTGLVPRLPSLVASGVLALLCSGALRVGLTLDATRKSRHEASRLAYLGLPSVRSLQPDPVPAADPVERRTAPEPVRRAVRLTCPEGEPATLRRPARLSLPTPGP